MADVVLKLPVREGEEALAFGAFLGRFIARYENSALDRAADNDAPYLMMHSDPRAGIDLKVLTFQENSVAQAFRSGWAAARHLSSPRPN